MKVLLILVLASCAVEDYATTDQPLSAAKRAERLTQIRDLGAEMGMDNAALLGGIAQSETGLAHCQSEATYACMGPASPSCGGAPIIAGSADGPCSLEQGGLGMFQFDAGTYAQTVAAYGDDVLTVEGNTALAVNFVVGKAKLDIAGVTDWRSAMAWMNAVPLTSGAPELDAWAQLLACRYNGCCSTSATCTSRANGYRDNALAVYGEMGAAFWAAAANRCPEVPADGVIDQRSGCYVAAGDPRYWRREPTGYADSSEWTMTTTAAAPANYAEWRIRANAAVTLHLDVHLDGGVHGKSTMAHYEIHHAGTVDTVTIDQTSGTGFVPLGDFAFAGGADEYVTLGDNTGDPVASELLFDALRVVGETQPGDVTPPPATDGGCAIGGGGGLLVGVTAGVAALGPRRRRRVRKLA
ncbi:MAG: hypothetical protein NT062_37215 [Proteobacteria bacterium]|nr:hypothetical protein [Pseudomonadota bacterium]